MPSSTERLEGLPYRRTRGPITFGFVLYDGILVRFYNRNMWYACPKPCVKRKKCQPVSMSSYL